MTNRISFEDTSIAFSYKSDRDLQRSHRLFSLVNNPLLVKLGTPLMKLAFRLKAPVNGLVKKTLFHQFCGGESIDDCQGVIEKLSRYHIGAILDYAVEDEDTEEDYDHTASEIIKTIELSKNNPNIPFCVFKPTGIASIEILRKVHEQEALTAAEKQSYEKIKARFFSLGKHAFENNVRLFVDSEDSWIQGPIDDLTYQMMEQYNRVQAFIFNTYQMYRKGMLENLVNKVHEARGKYIVGAKLVRGAYMEKERRRADKLGYEDPIMPGKPATDRQYDAALRFCVENIQYIHFCSGSHNERSNLYLAELMAENGLAMNDPRVWFAQLYGMSDNISFNLANAGYNVTKYLPYGPVEAVVPYLIRRAEENTAIAGQSSRELALIKKEMKRRGREEAAAVAGGSQQTVKTMVRP